MSQQRKNVTKAAYGRNTYTNNTRVRNEYIYGNAVRKADVQWEAEEAPKRQPHHEVRKNREKAHHMSAGYVIFLAVALFASIAVLVNYIQLEAELTELTKAVATKEHELNSLKITNDEAYNRILNSVDLEEVRRIAIEELGMVYAQEGQVIIYENESDDYMRKVTESN